MTVTSAQSSGPGDQPPINTTFGLIFAMLAVSTAPVFVKACVMAPAFVSGARLVGTSVLLLPVAWRYLPQLKTLSRGERLRLAAAGACMGLHFICFISAFQYTSYESTVILLVSQPVFAAVLGRFLLGEVTSVGEWLAVAVACAGMLLLMGEDFMLDRDVLDARHLFGDGLVLLGSVFVVLFGVLSRGLRRKLQFAVYTTVSYGFGGVIALAWAFLAGERFTGYDNEAWYWLLALIFVPTLMGHTTFNFLLKHVRVFFVNFVILAEPLLAMLAKVALDWPERFGPIELGPAKLVGGTVMVVGVALGLVVRERKVRRGKAL